MPASLPTVTACGLVIDSHYTGLSRAEPMPTPVWETSSRKGWILTTSQSWSCRSLVSLRTSSMELLPTLPTRKVYAKLSSPDQAPAQLWVIGGPGISTVFHVWAGLTAWRRPWSWFCVGEASAMTIAVTNTTFYRKGEHASFRFSRHNCGWLY